jgi:hypothetical protein
MCGEKKTENDLVADFLKVNNNVAISKDNLQG